jgi:hypothetical protein
MEERGQGNSNDGRKAPPALVDVRNELNCKVKIEKMKGNEKIKKASRTQKVRRMAFGG